MNRSVLDKLISEEKYRLFLRENSNYYKELNRDYKYYDAFKKEMKEKYKLRVIDKVDNVVDSIDLISKFMDIK